MRSHNNAYDAFPEREANGAAVAEEPAGEIAEAMRLLKSACRQETLVGAIQNMLQVHGFAVEVADMSVDLLDDMAYVLGFPNKADHEPRSWQRQSILTAVQELVAENIDLQHENDEVASEHAELLEAFEDVCDENHALTSEYTEALSALHDYQTREVPGQAEQVAVLVRANRALELEKVSRVGVLLSDQRQLLAKVASMLYNREVANMSSDDAQELGVRLAMMYESTVNL